MRRRHESVGMVGSSLSHLPSDAVVRPRLGEAGVVGAIERALMPATPARTTPISPTAAAGAQRSLASWEREWPVEEAPDIVTRHLRLAGARVLGPYIAWEHEQATTYVAQLGAATIEVRQDRGNRRLAIRRCQIPGTNGNVVRELLDALAFPEPHEPTQCSHQALGYRYRETVIAFPALTDSAVAAALRYLKRRTNLFLGPLSREPKPWVSRYAAHVKGATVLLSHDLHERCVKMRAFHLEQGPQDQSRGDGAVADALREVDSKAVG